MLKPRKLKQETPVNYETFDIETSSTGKLILIAVTNGDAVLFFHSWREFLEYAQTIDYPIILWSYNGGRFDMVGLFRDMLMGKYHDLLENYRHEKTMEQCVCINNGTILSLKLKFKCHGGKHVYVTLADFNNFLKGSLENLLKQWQIDTQKIELPDGIKNKMEQLYRDNRQLFVDYLTCDVKGLRELLDKFRKLTEQEFGILNIGITAPGLAMKIFTLHFLPNPIVTSSGKQAAFERLSYRGGLTRFWGDATNGNRTNSFDRICDVCYYDINSSYVSTMERMHLPYRSGGWTIGILPRDKNGKLVQCIAHIQWRQTKGTYPILPSFDAEKSKWTDKSVWEGQGYYPSPEIELILKYGEIIAIFRVLVYRYCSTIFKEFAGTVYAKRLESKKNGNKPLEELYKLIGNSLYGKFGMRTIRETLAFVHETDKDRIPKEIPLHPFDNGWFTFTLEREMRFIPKYIFPAIAAFITSDARTTLMNMHFELAQQCKPVIYCDTDSVMVRGEMPNEYVDASRLGAWKLEGTGWVQIAGPKLYRAHLDTKGDIVRGKGLRGISFKDFDLIERQGYSDVEFSNPTLIRSALLLPDIEEPNAFKLRSRRASISKSYAESGNLRMLNA